MTDLTNLQSHIDSLNADREASGDLFRMAEAAHFFEMYGISTVEAFEEHMDLETYSDWYKDRNGFRPRGPITVVEARRKMALWVEWEEEEQAELRREAEIEAQRWEEVTAPAPRNSALLDAFKKAEG